MKRISRTRLISAMAMGAFGVLAACSPRKEETTDTLATTPPATATTPSTGDMSSGWTDANVVDVLTVANQGEFDYSQIGVDKATNQSVKQFAELMVKDHGTMLDAVKSLASKLNVTPAGIAERKSRRSARRSERDTRRSTNKSQKEDRRDDRRRQGR